MKPILQYVGGKQADLSHFASFIPQKIKCYYEPFVGGGSVYFYLAPKKAVLSDINRRLIDFYKGIQKVNINSELAELAVRYKIEDPKQLYYHLRDVYNGKVKDKYSKEAVYYFINKTAFRGLNRVNNKGEFNASFGFRKNFPSHIDEKAIEILKNAEIKCCSYEQSFNKADKKDFMFLDPPYHTTFSRYGNKEDFSEDQQRKLAQDFRNLSTRALLIINEDNLTKELYTPYIKGKYSKKFNISYAMGNKPKHAVTHLIISNY